MRRWIAAPSLMVLVATGPGAVAVSWARANDAQEYVVLYRVGSSADAVHRAIRDLSGTLVEENEAVGVATVRSSNPQFLDQAGAQAAFQGAARNRPVGEAPALTRPKRDETERLSSERREAGAAGPRPAQAPPGAAGSVAPEPLAGLQWDMAMIRATASESYAVQRGDKRVLVGIMDTGIDGSHPDIAPNFDRALSRNFTTDIPLIDGPCADEPDHSCSDPPDVDEDGHGTHVAGIVGAPLNRLGIAGVAPDVALVNLRAGQDSGFFFLQPTVDALTFAGDHGIDVVNMSFYIDPWLFNCPNNAADSPAERMEQRTIIAATQRALDYAHNKGVTMVSALGNDHIDLANPTLDPFSPDFPPGTARTRTVDSSCVDMPTEGHNVIGVSSIGPSTNKADYSNYGLGQNDVAAPGGFYRDFAGTPRNRTIGNLILSAYPESLARASGDIDSRGRPTTPFVVRDCRQRVCAYYQYLQGTSMAAPHAAGVAALIVSQFGYPDPADPGGGLTFPPAAVEAVLIASATPHACPVPPLISYANVDRPPDWDALCVGNSRLNSIWGYGIVDALGAVNLRPRSAIP